MQHKQSFGRVSEVPDSEGYGLTMVWMHHQQSTGSGCPADPDVHPFLLSLALGPANSPNRELEFSFCATLCVSSTLIFSH